MTNFQKLKQIRANLEAARQNSGLESHFFYSLLNINAIEKYCNIPQGNLARAIKRNQKTVAFDDKLSKLFDNCIE